MLALGFARKACCSAAASAAAAAASGRVRLRLLSAAAAGVGGGTANIGPTSAATAPIRPSLNFKGWRDNLEYHRANIRNRNVEANVDAAVEAYEQYVAQLQRVEQLRHERNRLTDSIKKMKDKKGSEFQELLRQSKQNKTILQEVESQMPWVEEAMLIEGLAIPNETHPDVPVGSEEQATVLQTVNEAPSFCFEPRDHLAIAQPNNLINFRSGAAVTGSRFYFLHGKVALLEFALVHYAINFMTQRGYEPVTVPDIVKTRVAESCGFQPRDDASQIYHLDQQHSVGQAELCLAGTAEIPLAGMWMGHTFDDSELTKKYIAVGHAFRCEAGGAGATNRGLYRVHQFTKAELFVISPGDLETSCGLHDEMLQDQIDLFASLGLHFKVLDMPTEDLGAPAYRKYDIEAWMPGRQEFGEISSTSNCTDYQSRRLNIRSRPTQAAPSSFVHTLNGTACAVPRMIVAIMETFQREDGDFDIPAVLEPYMPHGEGRKPT
ncbi:hypothetical protein PTSG_01539 [Salpingoeca rosetta]|uniref:serine--tRNA ligase n=1 Tax=Salpingoeca rosetta (strain ATCC 50818 / BSB-021) TaxID=946362 RepID=F2U0M8_SALR5|nr:uncharacterized protein PTSG_01539 [Salpingoeca rosetta]EGD80956.1 hypothetical protein PTSG_01539 [Salpingoeca rosetta]|eukprot:XP_004997517.1 hypothetical protein PTSG_01539 [Salpingoeca rosetta]